MPAELAHKDSPPAAAGHCAGHTQERAYPAPAVAEVTTAAEWCTRRYWSLPSSVCGLAAQTHIWVRPHSDAPAASVAVAVSGIDVD